MEATIWAYVTAIALGLVLAIVSLLLASAYDPLGATWRIVAGIGGPLLAIPLISLPAWCSISRTSSPAGWIFAVLVGLATFMALAWVEAVCYSARRPMAK